MPLIEIQKITSGAWWVAIPAANLRLLCGAPANVVKHLRKKGFISTTVQKGITFETGPNAILLADTPYQHGNFYHLTEFPILQMLYLQGMILPNHPNNCGEKPILIGRSELLEAQLQYIHRGNYGLLSLDELLASGLDLEEAQRWYRVKLQFAFGKIVPPNELLELKNFDNDKLILKNEVEIERQKENIFRIGYKGESVTIDLNSRVHQDLPPYRLPKVRLPRCTFGIVHTGEGDGWDVTRPCMASLIIYRGKYYLIDAGANIFYTLRKLGIAPQRIAGIFLTHLHDDHFAGMLSWFKLSLKKPIPFFATQPVLKSVMFKLEALLKNIPCSIEQTFVFHSLQEGTWHLLDGMEVMPFFSLHPVETNCFSFRVKHADHEKTYTHLADIAAKAVLEKMMQTEKESLKSWLEAIFNRYLLKADIKKVDAGGGMIHGNAEDFLLDTSTRIYLSHNPKVHKELPPHFHANASFGQVDILIP